MARPAIVPPDMRANIVMSFWSQFEVIFQDHTLTVGVVVFEIWIVSENVEQVVHQIAQHHPGLLE